MMENGEKFADCELCNERFHGPDVYEHMREVADDEEIYMLCVPCLKQIGGTDPRSPGTVLAAAALGSDEDEDE